MSLFKSKEEKCLCIKRGLLVSFTSGRFTIRCNRGIICVTWPGSRDTIMRDRDVLSLTTGGKVCLTAFADSDIHIKKE